MTLAPQMNFKNTYKKSPVGAGTPAGEYKLCYNTTMNRYIIAQLRDIVKEVLSWQKTSAAQTADCKHPYTLA